MRGSSRAQLLFLILAIFVILPGTNLFAKTHVFYTQSENNARRNLAALNPQNYTSREIIPLVGKYDVLDSKNGSVQGQINIPGIYREQQEIFLRKKFPKFSEVKATYTFHFAGITGNSEIRINGRLFYSGKLNFIPLSFNCPGYLLTERENILEIHIKPWQGNAGEFPEWTPVNLPRIFNGISAPVYLIVQHNQGIQTLAVQKERQGDTLNFKTRATFLPTDNYPLRLLTEISLWRNEKKILQKRLFTAHDSSKATQEFSFNITDPAAISWSPEDPEVYRINFRILGHGQYLSAAQQPVFHRTLTRKGNALQLNGKPIKIQGINYIYQDTKGSNLMQLPLLIQDLKNIKRAGFNAIRLGYFPVNELIYTVADTMGILCFQDLPISISHGTSAADSLRFAEQMQYLAAFLKMADRHPSLVGIGFKFHGANAPTHAAWKAIRNNTAGHQDYWLYSCSNDYNAGAENDADFVCLDILKRNRQEFELTRLDNSLSQSSATMVSALSKPISYRMDSTAIVHDLKQIHELFLRFNKGNWRKKLAGNFLLTYSDYYLNTPSLQAGPQNQFTLNAAGLYSRERKLKKDAQAILNRKYIQAIQGGVESEKSMVSTYIFTIIGLINFLFFLVFYRSSIEFQQNIKRAIKKPHGFFSDLRERRLISLTENFFLILFLSVNGSVMISSLFYFFRNNYYMDYLLSLLFFQPAAKTMVINSIWQPVILVPVIAVLIFTFVVALAIPIRLSAFFRPQIIRTRQSLAVCAWAGAPFIFLLPFGMFFYNLLLVLNSYWILIGVLLYFHVWYFYRWTNGMRVLSELTFSRAIFINLLLMMVLGSGVYFYLNYEIQIGKHLVYLFQLFRTLN